MGQPAETLWRSQPRTLLKHQVYCAYPPIWRKILISHMSFEPNPNG